MPGGGKGKHKRTGKGKRKHATIGRKRRKDELEPIDGVRLTPPSKRYRANKRNEKVCDSNRSNRSVNSNASMRNIENDENNSNYKRNGKRKRSHEQQLGITGMFHFMLIFLLHLCLYFLFLDLFFVFC